MKTQDRKALYVSPELHQRLMVLHETKGRSERRVWQTAEELLFFALTVMPVAEGAIGGSELESN